eukprot:5495394-Amphidinium_carterae.1
MEFDVRQLNRHHNRSACCRNSMNHGGPLSDLGEAQAEALGTRLQREGFKPDCVVSSHAKRARRTAEIVCKHIAVDKIEVDERVVELSQGVLAVFKGQDD